MLWLMPPSAAVNSTSPLPASEHGEHDIGILRAVNQAKFGSSGERLADQFLRLDQRMRRIAETMGHREVEEHGQRLIASGCDSASAGGTPHEACRVRQRLVPSGEPGSSRSVCGQRCSADCAFAISSAKTVTGAARKCPQLRSAHPVFDRCASVVPMCSRALSTPELMRRVVDRGEVA